MVRTYSRVRAVGGFYTHANEHHCSSPQRQHRLFVAKVPHGFETTARRNAGNMAGLFGRLSARLQARPGGGTAVPSAFSSRPIQRLPGIRDVHAVWCHGVLCATRAGPLILVQMRLARSQDRKPIATLGSQYGHTFVTSLTQRQHLTRSGSRPSTSSAWP